ncbi:MAG: winged helix-turn-helix domain-containing protein [Bacteroidia bacterium]
MLKFLKPILAFVFLFSFQIEGKSNAQRIEQRNEVALRLIAHNLLHSAGDSTSRVLPIVRKDDSYLIQFENEFAFRPDTLVEIINRVITENEIAGGYNVQVLSCDSQKVVHAFEVDFTQYNNMLPCRGRNQPKACYEIEITLFGVDAGSENASELSAEPNHEVKTKYLLIPLVLVIVAGGAIYKLKSGDEDKQSNDSIAIGNYKLNKLTAELEFEGKVEVLSTKELELLLLLHSNANETVEREQILSKVWNDEGAYVGRTLDVFISKLRKKLEADEQLKIVNVRGVGYRLLMKN